MDNARNSSNWIALLRRKIQKKFKRNRQKSSEVDQNETEAVEVQDEEQQQQQEQEQSNQVLEIVDQDENTEEHTRELKKELYKLSCYWQKLSRAEAQRILKNQPNGSFLIRDSGTDNSITLSFRSNNKTFHCRNQWNTILNSQHENSIISAIEESIRRSKTSVVGFVKCENQESISVPIAVRLIYPIKRTIPSLQNLCLSLVVSNINQTSNIHSLPLPPKIKEIVELQRRETMFNTL